ncbi:MAG: indolepyruvate oxidoreductase subunit beta [Dehalococcoidales bacterium]|nr:indolepyruvate oxidoreductase subunit beta [Dehalococcoidales bacterium]
MSDINALIVGVGGQGVILASDALAEIGMNNGRDTKKSDSIGMSQRGGGVVSHVRWGKRIFSPLIKKGEVDVLVGFEQLETARWTPYLKPGAIAIVADAVILPVSAIGGSVPYPSWSQIQGILKQYAGEVYLIPANAICEELGNPRVLNMVMLGSLSVFMELKEQVWKDDICRRLAPQFVDLSVKAFTRGAETTRAMRQKQGRSNQLRGT